MELWSDLIFCFLWLTASALIENTRMITTSTVFSRLLIDKSDLGILKLSES
jgi:hypothetical protein